MSSPNNQARTQPKLEDLARQRIVMWMHANPHITQTTIAKAIGVSQTWVSQYKSGEQGASLDQLDGIARVFGHTLMELLDLRPDPKERALIDAFRALPVDRRDLAVKMLEAMVIPSSIRPRHK
jgi:predicted transcriptional regulator